MSADPPIISIRPRTKRLGQTILHVAEATSTMDLARERAKAGAPEGLVVVADRQTAGVGRLERPWANVGKSLYFTVVLRPKIAAPGLSLLPLTAGVSAVAASKRLLKVDLSLKWPNDVMHGARKLGGILVEASYQGKEVPEFVLVGVGVNGDVRQAEFPPEIMLRATSLSIAADGHVCLPAWLKLFLEALEHRYDRIVGAEPGPVWTEARAFLSTLGKKVRVTTPEAVIEGDAVDLGPEGELLVRVANETKAILAGDCEELRDA
jgi:BirA family biotin operon repressor/biotin-[acetyl-CoA-carboxylase] ligase